MPIIGDYRFIDFKVNCMRDYYKVRDMTINQIYTDKGWFPAPCNGCDEFNGNENCTKCISYLTSMFFRDPELDISKPITPVEQSK